ncbi:g9089 [Coccomyxa elongata]
MSTSREKEACRMEDVWSGQPADQSASQLSLPSDWVHVEDGLAYAAEETYLCNGCAGDEEARSLFNNSRSKRQRRSEQLQMPSMEDEAVAELEEQCLRLKAHNRQLHAALTAIQEKAQRVGEENRRLMRLINLLAPNKGCFQLLPQLSASASSVSAALNEDPCRGDVNASSGSPVPVADDAGTAEAEAVAAAALALNQGNPAAALIDLLTLTARHKEARQAQRNPPDVNKQS